MAQSTCGSAPARSAPCPVSPRRSAAWRAATAQLPVALVLVGAGSPALAATPIPTTATINVTANVVNGCQVYLAPNQKTGIPFGVLDFGTQPPTRTGTVSVMAAGGASQAQIQCTPGTMLKIVANGGQHSVNSQRHLANGALRIPYTLTLMSGVNPALTPSSEVTMLMGVAPAALPVQGTVTLPGSGLLPGIYSDTVQVTLSW